MHRFQVGNLEKSEMERVDIEEVRPKKKIHRDRFIECMRNRCREQILGEKELGCELLDEIVPEKGTSDGCHSKSLDSAWAFQISLSGTVDHTFYCLIPTWHETALKCDDIA